jgi:hypothetical protein
MPIMTRRAVLMDTSPNRITFYSDAIKGRSIRLADIGIEQIKELRYLIERGVGDSYRSFDNSDFKKVLDSETWSLILGLISEDYEISSLDVVGNGVKYSIYDTINSTFIFDTDDHISVGVLIKIILAKGMNLQEPYIGNLIDSMRANNDIYLEIDQIGNVIGTYRNFDEYAAGSR